MKRFTLVRANLKKYLKKKALAFGICCHGRHPLIKESLLFIIPLFLGWRLNLQVVAWVGYKLFSTRGGFLGPTPWANFDGVHYLAIAQNGYSVYQQAFFPLYPMLIRLLGGILGNDLPLAALLISNLSLLGVLLLVWSLTKSRWVLVFLLFFPTSFYFAAVYTESLFLFFVLVNMLILRELSLPKKFTTVLHSMVEKKSLVFLYVVLAGLASATRLVGVFLGVPLGLFGYMLYLFKSTGDPLAFLHVQPAFGAGRSGGRIILLPQTIWRYIKIFATVSYKSYNFRIALLEFIMFLGALLLLWQGWKQKLPKFWLLFSLVSIIIPTLTGTLSSMPRYVLVAFPIYIVLAKFKSRIRYLALIACYLLQMLLTILFTQGHWVA